MSAPRFLRKTAPLAGVFLLLGGALSAPAFAQAFTHADSGWVRLFNGNDFTGFYSRTYNISGANAPKVVPPAAPYSIEYAGTDTATIRVGSTATAQLGNIGTLDTTFSHYRLRWESKYDAINANSNSGLTYHTDESAIRMNNNWPRSIEFQGKQSEVGSAFSIQQVTFTTRASSSGQGANYVSTGGGIVQACEVGCNGRWYKGNPLIPPYATATPTVPRWLRFELVARGADSAIHIVNDTTVMRLWNIRIFNDSTKTTGSTNSNSSSASNMTPAKPWDRGGLGWQAEGALVRYRRLEVMRIPPTTPMNEHFLHRLFQDAPVGPVKPAPSSQVALAWRSIGTIPKVKIEYRSGTGAWQTAVDSVPNTGSYNWTAPGSVPDSLRFRISSVSYVWADSTDDVGPTSIRYGLPESGKQVYTVRGGALRLQGTGEFSRLEVRDFRGRRVYSMAVTGADAVWNLTAQSGEKVRPGLYFFRLSGVRDEHSDVKPFDGRVLVE